MVGSSLREQRAYLKMEGFGMKRSWKGKLQEEEEEEEEGE